MLINLLQDLLYAKRISILEKKIFDSKTVKYFFAAGFAGHYICKKIRIQGKKNNEKKCYQLLFSYWAILLINLDAYSDSKENTYEDNIYVNLMIANDIFEELMINTNSINRNEKFVMNNWLNSYSFSRKESHKTKDILTIQYFSKKFVHQLVCCLKEIQQNSQLEARNISEALNAFILLADAQIGSFLQREISETYNWNWYSKTILKNKFDNVFRPILNVIPKEQEEVCNINQIIVSIDFINELFLHRQILDDLIDFEEDIENGILATPTYLLLDFDRNASSIDFLEKNVFEKLQYNKTYKRGSFSKAWERGQFNFCKQLLIESSIMNYIVEIIEDDKRVNDIYKRIDGLILGNQLIAEIISLYYNRCVKSYNSFKVRLFKIYSV